ncbi:nucleotidyltransferase AbiEii toxin of type IV toxin-antitoxin system [Promicromonospora sp. AC04]|uniref:nucleotidyl transferase AbiEii/AbiGii toxin family protein n=1 Tax=Promicromonospora sp. AC04 TaxID=2135723 RepID=UPI000D4AD80B|nr:nucleotidyl transferase AbiEii/AbiGii toxin family protein [Promicromonospora sp. AC04]PUB29911.1 nucleotidyltransferase AbiEii toxin of type IV toxin-antitoxin system [Promicromonospora sp. AC04]
MLYKLERTLNRLALTRFRDRFVLKGGLLLAAYKGRRPTKDIDGMIRDMTLDEEAVRWA